MGGAMQASICSFVFPTKAQAKILLRRVHRHAARTDCLQHDRIFGEGVLLTNT